MKGGKINRNYLDYRHHVGSGNSKLGHINIEMVELVPFSFSQNNVAAIPNGMNAAKVSSGIQGGIGRSSDRELWNRGGQTTCSLETGGFQRDIRGPGTGGGDIGFLFILVAVNGLFGVFAFEEAHIVVRGFGRKRCSEGGGNGGKEGRKEGKEEEKEKGEWKEEEEEEKLTRRGKKCRGAPQGGNNAL